MSGIAGMVSTASPDGPTVQRMCDVLRHPDADAHAPYVDGQVAFGGGQPARDENGTTVAVCDGELYNAAELRGLLQRQGHRFATDSDTECLVHLYEEFGDDLVRRLRGPFAFALWDTRRRRLLLARDRLGEKPLSWRDDGVRLWFAGRTKALIEDPTLARRVDPVALHHYLTYQYVPAPWSIYAGVHKLPPGHLLTWQSGIARVRPYWRLDATPRPVTDEAEAAQHLREQILDAVKVRLTGEHRVGAILSGDPHSAAVVAAMARQSSGPVPTFNVSFDETRFEARRYARTVARRYGTDHHELVVTSPPSRLLPELAWQFDEPFADPAAIARHHTARLTRPHVGVLLGGDGGDETFGDLPRDRGAMTTVPRLPPAGLFDLVGTALGRHAASGGRLARLGRTVRLLGLPPLHRYARVCSAFSHRQKLELYTADLRARLSELDSLDLMALEYERARAADPAGRLICTDVNTGLPGMVLTTVDICGAGQGQPARSPLLDHRLLEWTARLPTALRRPGGLFAQAMAPWLPDEVINRPRPPVGVPLAAWLRGDLRDLARDLLTDDTARSRGLFRREVVTAMFDRHAQGHDESRRLWTLMQFELWHRRFLDPAPVVLAAQQLQPSRSPVRAAGVPGLEGVAPSAGRGGATLGPG